ncbi:Mu transposase C-terminal domain-containing protein [Roseospira goensis]|uniref:Putative transposase n=1 Tax=Roseospira goensis TaxID=391922 RepID=A0A7W6S1Y2_9PROT|nr:Mu transposase C-terminal domain-containing protein [Roseospira goensis]MBB4287403.1 putative transposase [Roseospira goensis]
MASLPPPGDHRPAASGRAAALPSPDRWYTAAELAALGLPGLPGTPQNITATAKRQSWLHRPRQGRGGGREYPVSALPERARAVLARREMTAEAPPPAVVAAERGQRDPADMRDTTRSCMAARAALCQEVDRIALEFGLSQRQAVQALVDQARAGKLPEPLARMVPRANARRGTSGSRVLSVRSVQRWLAARAAGDVVALAPAEEMPREWPPWVYPLMKLRQRPQEPSIAACLELWPEDAPVPAPSYDQARRFVASLGAIAKHKGRVGPRELKRVRAYTIRSIDGLLPGDVYTADGHCHDCEVAHPLTGKPFRPEIIGVVCVRTRKCVGWSAWTAESEWLVAAALRVAVVQAGVPAIWYVDNGCGFRNRAHNDPVTGLMARLGITPRNSLPYNSQARGVIERFHQTCWIRPARELDAYVGRDMDAEARKLTFKVSRKDIKLYGHSPVIQSWDAFLAWAETCRERYNTRPHSALPRIRDPETGKMRHRTPAEQWDALLPEAEDLGVAPTRLSPDEARDLFRPHEIRVVRRAWVHLGGRKYFSQVLDDLDLHGVEVRVEYDPRDMGRVWVRDLDGRLICEAAQDGNVRPYFNDDDVQEAREGRATAMDAMALRDESAAPVLLAEPPAPAPRALTADEEAAKARLAVEMAAPKPKDETPKERWWRAHQTLAAHAAGRPVDAEALRWARGYAATPEYRSHEAALEEWGDVFLHGLTQAAGQASGQASA